MELNKIYQGDTLQVLETMPDEFVDTIITSPPYWGLRDYGKETKVIWDGDKNCEHNFGTKIPRKYHKAGETNPGKEGYTKNAGAWGQTSGQFCQKCGAWYGQLGLEPTLDLYISHLLQITQELKRVLKKSGIMFWNHGDCYGGSGQGSQTGYGDKKRQRVIGTMEKALTLSLTPKCLALQNYRLILKMIDQGWILRNTIIWHKPNHMPSSVKDRFANSYEPIFMLVKNKKYWFDLDAVRKPSGIFKKFNLRVRDVKRGYFIKSEQYKASKKEVKQYHGQNITYNPMGKNPGDVWTIPTQPFPAAHFATFPLKLVEPMIKSSCPLEICKKCGKARVRIKKPSKEYAKNLGTWTADTDKSKKLRNEIGFQAHTKKKALTAEYQTIGWTDCGCKAGWRPGTTLDPFGGAGTTGVMAKKLMRNYILIDIKAEYCKMSTKRILDECGGLF